jgi:hypothetical protein
MINPSDALQCLEVAKSAESIDFPFAKYQHEPPQVLEGLQTQWAIGVVMRRKLRDLLPTLEERRAFEYTVRETCAGIRNVDVYVSSPDTDIPASFREESINRMKAMHQKLMMIHHLSVTADQAELCAQAF